MSVKLSQQIFGASVAIAISALFFFLLHLAEKGKVPYVRRLPAMDGMDYAIDRAGELGKPVYCELGGTLSGTDGVQLSAALGMLPYIARRCAHVGARLMVGYYANQVTPLIRGSLDLAEETEGKKGFFRMSDLQFLPSENAFHPFHIIEYNDCRAAIAIGRISLQALSVAEANKVNGCIAIEGTAFMNQIHAIGLLAEYSFIGEELFAASAGISADAESKVTLRVEDIIKLGTLALIPVMYVLWKLGISL